MDTKFTEKVFPREDCNIHYWVNLNQGKPWLIFLHGAGLDHNSFNNQLNILKNKFNIIAVDGRGHGASRPAKIISCNLMIEDILLIMKKEGCAKGTFIGHSMGGNLAQEIAFRYTDKVESLILIDCTSNTLKLSPLEKVLLSSTFIILRVYPWKLFCKNSAKISTVKDEVYKYIIESFNNIGKKDLITILRETAKFIHYEEGYNYGKDMLLLCGEYDKTGNIKKVATSIAALEKHCDFYWIKDAGHCAPQDNPQMVNEKIITFLKKVYNKKGDIPIA